MSRRRGTVVFAVLAVGVLFAASARGGSDGGVSVPDASTARPAMSEEDREVVENLELLQSLEETSELEVLLELAD